jgi:hypothetical protein
MSTRESMSTRERMSAHVGVGATWGAVGGTKYRRYEGGVRCLKSPSGTIVFPPSARPGFEKLEMLNGVSRCILI